MNLLRSRLRSLFAHVTFTASVLILAVTANASNDGSSTDPAIRMPEYVVKGDLYLRWRYARVFEFEVISTFSDEATEEYVAEIAREVAMIRALFPDGFLPRPTSPSLLVLGMGGLPDRSEAALDGWVGATLSDGSDYDTSVYLLNASWFESNRFERGRDRKTLAAIKHACWLLDCRTPRLPDWFIHGTRAFLYWTRFRDRSIQLPGDLSVQAPPDLKSLIEREQPGLARPAATGVRRAQDAAVFVLWGLLDREYTEKFWTFVQRASSENVTEEAFKECFGFGYAEGARKVAGSFPRLSENSDISLPRSATTLPKVELRAARFSEAGRLVGEWHRQLASIQTDKRKRDAELANARECFVKALPKTEDPELLAALGICEKDAGLTASAIAHLEVAIRAKVSRPRAYLDYARLLYASAASGTLSETDTRAILAPLHTARAKSPALPGIYALMTEVWERSSVQPTPMDLEALEEGTRLFPRDVRLASRAFQIHSEHGRKAKAAEMANRLLKAVNPSTRETLRDEASAHP